MIPPVPIKAVLRLCQKDPVQNFQCPAVTGTDAKHHKGHLPDLDLQQLQLLARDPEAHQIFHLGEEEILWSQPRIASEDRFSALLPPGKPAGSCPIFQRAIQAAPGRHGLQQLRQTG